jgi:hypothetical protein
MTMSMIIDVQSREFSTEMLEQALTIPAARGYVGHLTVDNGDAVVTFDGDVELLGLDNGILRVAQWDETTGESSKTDHTFPIGDVRRVELY